MYELSVNNSKLRQATLRFLKSKQLSFEETGEIIKVNTKSNERLDTYIAKKKSYVSYNTIQKIIKDMVYIQNFLEEIGGCIAYYSMKDIMVLNDSFFLFTNSKKVFEVRDENIIISRPINKEEPFLYGELIDAEIIPMIFPYKITYKSLGLLALKLLVPENRVFQFNEDLKERLYPSGLYWFLENIFNNDVKNMTLIII
tara:strand:+ start:476 stop:1072 length:597 start_codon:yes stop_codon:yes gene_type:complete